MTRTTLLSAIATILHAPRDENGILADREATVREVDGILCAEMDEGDFEPDDGADLFEAATPRKEGEVFKGPSGRWFTIKKGRVVPARTPQGGAAAGGNASSPDVAPGGEPASPADRPTASKRPNKDTRITPEQAEQQIAEFQAKATVQPSDLRDLANTLAGLLDAGLTKEQLQGIARKHASKLTGKKQQLASALAQTALAAIKSGEASKPTDAVTTHLQAYQGVKQGTGDAKRFLAGVKKLKAGDVKALAQKITNQKVPTKAMGMKVISEAVGVGETSGKEGPQQTPTKEPERKPAESQPLTPDTVRSLVSKVGPDSSGYVPIWKLRQAAGNPENFDAALKQMRRDGQARLVAIGDRSRMTPEQLKQSITGEGETLAYLELQEPQEQPAEKAPEPATPSPDVARPADNEDDWVDMGDTAPSPAPAPATTPEPKSAHVQRVEEQTAMFSKAISSSPHLNDQQKQSYASHATKVINAMTPAALERFAKNQTAPPEFLASTKDIGPYLASAFAHNPEMAKRLKGSHVGGSYFWTKTSGVKFALDGDYDVSRKEKQLKAESNEAVTGVQIYAHEFSHAIDGPRHELSGSPEWQKAFADEMKGGRLNEYAASAPHEGFAEFGRLILSGEHDLGTVAIEYPQCFAFWKAKGLVPEQSTGKGDATLGDIFSRRVDLGGAAHADVLKDGGATSTKNGIRESHTLPLPDVSHAFSRRPLLNATDARRAFGEHLQALLESGRVRKVEGFLGGEYYARGKRLAESESTDSLGRHQCYDDTTGKHVACHPGERQEKETGGKGERNSQVATPDEVIGKGSTGDVRRQGNEVRKSGFRPDGTQTPEGRVYKRLSSTEGIAPGKEDDATGDIVTPHYKHIISIDAIPPEKRKTVAPLVAKNRERINAAVTSLSDLGGNYNDPLQFGMGEGHKFDLLDFSNVSKESRDSALDENLAHLRTFYEQFGMEEESRRIGKVADVLRGMREIQRGEDGLGYWGDELGQATVDKLTAQLDGREPKYAYYATNGRHVGIGGVAQTEPQDGLKVILSDVPLAPDQIRQWELMPVVHPAAKRDAE